jgi:hypothetical protein
MKKLEFQQMEAVCGGGPEDCANVVIGSAKVLIADPVFFLTLYDPVLLTCLF